MRLYIKQRAFSWLDNYKIFDEEELRKGKGGINLLTKGKITRIDQTKQAIIMALTQFINGEIWK